MIQRTCVLGLLATSLMLAQPMAVAQPDFPSKPLRIIVTFGAGGSGDLVARAVAQELGAILGQPVVVENRAGGGGTLGADHAAKAPADGYTILQYTNALAVNMVLQPHVNYDMFKDFTPLYYAAEAPLALLTPSNSNNLSVDALVAYAKSQPAGIAFGHGGSGSMSHLSGELFSRAGNLKAVSVGYKGNGPAMTDLLGGRLDYYFSTINDVLPSIKGGKLNALAVTSADRDTTLPNVPTMVELGFKDFTPAVSWGYLVPKNTPAPIALQLQEALAKVIATPAMQQRLQSVGANSSNAGGPDVMTAKMQTEIARWKPIIEAANIQPE